MSDQTTPVPVFFQPLPEHDTLNVLLLFARISERVLIAESGCWEWQGAKTSRGYGNLGVGIKNVPLHRFVYSYCIGKIDKRLFICHRCDNPICCNPAHLFAGSAKDNTADMLSKGREGGEAPHGEESPKAKLTTESVLKIRKLCAGHPRPTIARLAKDFGVSTMSIWRVLRRETWNHLPEE